MDAKELSKNIVELIAVMKKHKVFRKMNRMKKLQRRILLVNRKQYQIAEL